MYCVLSPCAWSLVSIAREPNRIRGNTPSWSIYQCQPRILTAYTTGQSNLCMCSDVLGFTTSKLSDILKTQLKRVEKLILFNGLWKGCNYFVLKSHKNEIKANHIDQNGEAGILIAEHFLKANGCLPRTGAGLSCDLLFKRWQERHLKPSFQSSIFHEATAIK